MEIKELNKRPNIAQNKRLNRKYGLFEKLIEELNKKDLPSEIVNSIINYIEEINAFSGSDRDFLKQIRKAQASILKLVEKELKLVTKNHYRNRWLAIGMAALGIPMGAAIGASIGNMSFIGYGIIMGMIIGITFGMGMDKKAKEAGKQLDVEIEY
ncbi:MAG: hypothetical protein HN778_14010 [Prolixibacteraceae bacterium]|jgi:hypothetical protein|nr:hypothetical protein [Prolixibacteraceae bacterium]MBT6004991.1 hypothetical protein [Prolixibacteraceae bacterium]MBT6998597.1 hypothetical protein [Prolixibacteraceae bacterium]MBT7395942.1 hypothetical protein [Prolixibacteraceae bacterium]